MKVILNFIKIHEYTLHGKKYVRVPSSNLRRKKKITFHIFLFLALHNNYVLTYFIENNLKAILKLFLTNKIANYMMIMINIGT